MRRLAIVLALAACGGGASRGPAWPARQEPETDGGESLAPRTAAAGIIEAPAAAPDDDAGDTGDLAALFADAAAATAPAATPEATPAAPAEDDVIIEEITIEVTDDDD